MKAGTPELLKFIKLQRRLQESRRGIIGLLEGLWLATAKNCPAGDIGRFTNEEIAILVDWDGDPDVLVDALVACGWIDRNDQCRLVVHDWAEHAPNHVSNNLKRWGKRFIVPTDDACDPKEHPKEHPKDDPYEHPSEPPKEVTPSQAKPSQTKPNQQLASLRAADEFFSLDGDGAAAVVRAANTLRKAFRSLDRKALWQVAWIAHCIDPGLPKDLLDRLREKEVRKPLAYMQGALRGELERKGRAWDEVIGLVPEPPREKEVVG